MYNPNIWLHVIVRLACRGNKGFYPRSIVSHSVSNLSKARGSTSYPHTLYRCTSYPHVLICSANSSTASSPVFRCQIGGGLPKKSAFRLSAGFHPPGFDPRLICSLVKCLLRWDHLHLCVSHIHLWMSYWHPRRKMIHSTEKPGELWTIVEIEEFRFCVVDSLRQN